MPRRTIDKANRNRGVFPSHPLTDMYKARISTRSDTIDRPNVKIYILCHNQERLEFAREKYANYYWAYPILMKYQDNTLENAFWKQLLEIKSEWETCEMVGALSPIAYRKINISDMHDIIINRRYGSYYHFAEKQYKLYKGPHPHIDETMQRIKTELNLEHPNAAYYNYWMATPHLMELFIHWFHAELLPCAQACPYIYYDSEYDGAIPPEERMQKFGTPYYPLMPFVLERMNICFFKKYLREHPDA
jgi:hypothetical protein